MPLYTVMTQDGLLSAEQRDSIAAELVRIHRRETAFRRISSIRSF